MPAALMPSVSSVRSALDRANLELRQDRPSTTKTAGDKVDRNQVTQEKQPDKRGSSEMRAYMQQQSWQSIIIVLGFIAFVGFALWITADHDYSAIWARPFIITGALIGMFLLGTGIASNQ
jgi:hypothetical protein